MAQGAVEIVRGMRDLAPAEAHVLAEVAARLEAVIARYGYQRLELPIVEQRDLYLRKLGEELAGKVYEFEFGGRALALRPEWTASVLRAYVANMQDQPLPLRLSYAGPVFRYERPQRHTYRQFSQVGVELIGGLPPRSDAEVLAIACAGLDQIGVPTYRIMIGHVGLARSLIAALDLPERTRSLLIWSMEQLRGHGVAAVRERLNAQLGASPSDLALPDDLDDAQAARLLRRVFEATRVDLVSGTRTPEAIVARLLRKLRSGDQQPQIDAALARLDRLAAIRGPIPEALAQLDALLAEIGVASPARDELHAVLGLAAAHGIDPARITLDLGLVRGLHYYTGTIFEIYSADDLQIAGGGRYDELIQSFGARQSVPAAGFAYGLERVVAALEPARHLPASPPEALVVAVEPEDYPYAVAVAAAVRAAGLRASLDVRARTLAANLRDAARRDLAFVAIVGAQERQSETVVWRNLATREEARLPFAALASLGEVVQ